MKPPFLMLAAALPLLSGCVNDRASLQIGEQQSLTVARSQDYPWSGEVLRSAIVMNMPQCMRRYRLPPDPGNAGRISVFQAEAGVYVLRDGLGQYRATLADCSMTQESRGAEAPGKPAGSFEEDATGRLRFGARK